MHPYALSLLSSFASLALVWSTSTILVAEEEVLLASGETVTGELVSECGTTLEIRRQIIIKHRPMSATVTISKDQITHRGAVASFAVQYQARVTSSPDTLEGHVALARWCVDHCLVKEAADNALRADVIDSDNVLVERLFSELGYIKVTDQWVREDEYLAKTGLVDYGGKIMTSAEAEKAKTIAADTLEHDAATQAIKDDQFYLAHGQEKIKELSDKLEKEKADLAKAKGDASAAKTRIDADTKKQADQANQPTPPANPTGGGMGGRRNNQQPQVTPAQQIAKDLADATAAYEKATEVQHTVDHLVASDQRRLTALQAAVGKAKDDLPVQQERLKHADDDLTTQTGKAPASSQDASTDAAKTGDLKADDSISSQPPRGK